MSVDGPSRGGDASPIRIDMLFYRETDRSYAIARHAHRIHQWYLLIHGAVDMELDAGTVALSPGQSIIIPPNLARSPRARGRAPGYLVAVFEALAIDLAPIELQVLETPAALQGDVQALVEELTAPRGGESRHLCLALLTRLLIGLKRSALAGLPPASTTHAVSHRELVARAEAFMERSFWRPLSRAEISRAVGVSEPHLGRLFRSSTGRSVLQRLTEIRIEHAKRLLRESDLQITQIALDIGISSFSHFSYTFKRATGLAPSDYRRKGGTGLR